MARKQPVTPEHRTRGRPLKTAVDASVDIRRAALKAFASAGFNGVSIQEIALKAGVAKPLVHYHYVSKDALWEAAVGSAVADLRAEVLGFQEALVQHTSPLELVRAVSMQLVVFASRHPELEHIVVDETGKGGPRADWLRANLLLPGYANGKALLEGLAMMADPGVNVKEPVCAGALALAGRKVSPPPVEHIVPIVLGVMNFPFLDADVVRSAYGVDVYSQAYVQRHGEMMFRVLAALLLQP